MDNLVHLDRMRTTLTKTSAKNRLQGCMAPPGASRGRRTPGQSAWAFCVEHHAGSCFAKRKSPQTGREPRPSGKISPLGMQGRVQNTQFTRRGEPGLHTMKPAAGMGRQRQSVVYTPRMLKRTWVRIVRSIKRRVLPSISEQVPVPQLQMECADHHRGLPESAGLRQDQW